MVDRVILYLYKYRITGSVGFLYDIQNFLDDKKGRETV